MQALRLAVPALALAAVLSAVVLTLALAYPTPDAGPRTPPNGHQSTAGEPTEPTARDHPEGKTLSESVPAEDVRGKPVPGLSRFPGSVRVAYSEGRQDGLAIVRARYMAEKPPGPVRDFYVKTLRSGGWRMANVEYAGGTWHFLSARGGREVGVTVSPGGGGSVVAIEFSRPLAQEGAPSAGGSKR